MSEKVDVYLDRDLFSSTFLQTLFKDRYGNIAQPAPPASHIACANGEVVPLAGRDVPNLRPSELLQLKIDDTRHSAIAEAVGLIWNGKITQEYTESWMEQACRNAPVTKSRPPSR
jgi:hypothetical protein